METERIIALLNEAPESGLTAGQISRELLLDESLVRRRLKSLLKENAIRIVSYFPTRYAPRHYRYHQQRGDEIIDQLRDLLE